MSRAGAVWTDTRRGTDVSGKQDLTRAVAVFSQPERLAGWQRYGLRFGGLALAIIGLALLGRESARVVFRRR